MVEQIEVKVFPVFIPTKSPLKSYNFYIVKNEGYLFLVDAGVDTDECWEAFNEVLVEIGFSLQDIDFIVLTHHHADHIGLVNRIRERLTIPVYAHQKALLRLRRDMDFLAKRIGFFDVLYREHGCCAAGERQVDRLKNSFVENKAQAITKLVYVLQVDDIIGGLQVVELPGHAPDQIGLLHTSSGSFFVGDHVIDHLSTNALVDMGESGEEIPALLHYEQSLKRCLDYPIKRMYSGHGIVIENALQIIADKLKRIEKKSEKVLQYTEQESTAAEIAKRMYKVYYEQIFSLVMSEVIGHCNRLVANGKLEKVHKKGFIYYRKKAIDSCEISPGK